jgi:hypothetical protein
MHLVEIHDGFFDITQLPAALFPLEIPIALHSTRVALA